MYYITTTEAVPYSFLTGINTRKIGNNWKIMMMNACNTANNCMRVLYNGYLYSKLCLIQTSVILTFLVQTNFSGPSKVTKQICNLTFSQF